MITHDGKTDLGEAGDGIRTRVRQFLFTTFYVADPSQLQDHTSLLEAGLVDSTGVLEIIQFLEATFGFRVEDDEIVPENLDTVEHLAHYISRKVDGHVRRDKR